MEPIREELEQKFRETNGHLDLSKLNSNEPVELKIGEPIPAETVTLRVRTETGKRTLIVRVAGSEKIKSVYDAVRPYLESGENARRFVLRTNFPSKAYLEADQKSLKEHGLAPSSALII